jgi:hypothetical protein
MTKEAEAPSVIGNLITQLCSMQQQPATPVKTNPTSFVGSPRTLAAKLTEIELEYVEEAARIDQAIQQKECELMSAQSVGNNEDSPELLRIERELNYYTNWAARIDQAIQQKECELMSAQSVGNNEDSPELLRIERELKALKVGYYTNCRMKLCLSEMKSLILQQNLMIL